MPILLFCDVFQPGNLIRGKKQLILMAKHRQQGLYVKSELSNKMVEWDCQQEILFQYRMNEKQHTTIERLRKE